jgi:ferredoxin
MLYIDPEVCIDCGACVSACPVEAIYAESDVPKKWTPFIAINAEHYEKERTPS